MKKTNLKIIILVSTFISVFAMMYYSSFVNVQKYYGECKSIQHSIMEDKKTYISRKVIINENTLVKKKLRDEQNSGYIRREGVPKTNSPNGNIMGKNVNEEVHNDINTPVEENSSENFDIIAKEQEKSVFKVSTGEIKENLTTSDKIKLLYVSSRLGKENYKKIKEYLYAENAEKGVLESLKLLKKDLSQKDYEKVRKIAGKFIDMDAAESLN